MIRILLVVTLLSLTSFAASTNKVDKISKTNQVDKVEKERKIEHLNNKIIIKARDKGSKKESDYQVEREFPLMFKNNKKAKKVK